MFKEDPDGSDDEIDTNNEFEYKYQVDFDSDANPEFKANKQRIDY